MDSDDSSASLSDAKEIDTSDSDEHFEQLSSSAKTMLMNIYKYVRSSVVCGECFGDPYECYLEETSKMSGIPKPTVNRVLNEFIHMGRIRRETFNVVPILLTDRHKSTIRSILHSMFEKGDVPSYLEKILTYLRRDKTLPQFGLPILKIILDSMRYMCVKKHDKLVIIEFNEYVLERVEYLKKIKEFREQNRRILYLDEIQIQVDYEDDSGPSKEKKTKLEDNPDEALKEVINVGHIGNENGFIKGCEWISPVQHEKDNKITEQCFQYWFSDILPKLKPKDVIVMDNANYHCGRVWINKIIKVRKKSQPLLIQKKSKKVKVFAVKEMAKKYDIEVLILPQYHNDLNPLEDMWHIITGYVEKQTFASKPVKDIIMEAIILVSKKVWDSNINKVKHKEEYLRQIDLKIDDAVDKYLYTNDQPNKPKETNQELNLRSVKEEADDGTIGEPENNMAIKSEPMDVTVEEQLDISVKQELCDDITIKEEPLQRYENNAFEQLETEAMIKQEAVSEQDVDPLAVKIEFP